jgi:hypothetical protein
MGNHCFHRNAAPASARLMIGHEGHNKFRTIKQVHNSLANGMKQLKAQPMLSSLPSKIRMRKIIILINIIIIYVRNFFYIMCPCQFHRILPKIFLPRIIRNFWPEGNTSILSYHHGVSRNNFNTRISNLSFVFSINMRANVDTLKESIMLLYTLRNYYGDRDCLFLQHLPPVSHQDTQFRVTCVTLASN